MSRYLPINSYRKCINYRKSQQTTEAEVGHFLYFHCKLHCTPLYPTLFYSLSNARQFYWLKGDSWCSMGLCENGRNLSKNLFQIIILNPKFLKYSQHRCSAQWCSRFLPVFLTKITQDHKQYLKHDQSQ